MRQLLLSTFIAVFSLSNVFANASAKPLSDCVAALDNLITVTNSAISLSAKDQQGLLDKATAIKEAYLAGKTADALQKLNDFGNKLTQLEATLGTSKAKLSSEDDQALRTALNEAIACLSSN
jgi:hypothetical protein